MKNDGFLAGLIIQTAFVIIAFLAISVQPCSIFCDNGKIPCGGYGATCEGFRGCVFPGECEGSGSNQVTVPTNYDVIRPYGPRKTTRSPKRRYKSSYKRRYRPSYRQNRSRYNRYFGKWIICKIICAIKLSWN